ncbi:hypothetical protein GCM10011351_09660 [Paraliobacillus quinghaiensis]|uniref:Uncharacterized protein n=1 Tax=Paraliobacillus quinghaiensis TaxID=470815 RepID=A0A917TKR4_9BACI|nr:hypothetical protein GCM10011351_09660 [Paraliobacillus quinghaiensis]
MKKKVIVASGLISVLIVALIVAVNYKSTPSNNETQDIKQLVNDYSVGEINNETASITPEQLIITDSNENESTYALPEDEFFVSIAPYVTQTHPCAIHSLTGCQGELVNEEFNVYIEDMDGNVVIDETMQSQANGFIDLWLPRDKTYQITISNNGKKQRSQFSTFENDNTCITTIQLT